MKPFFTTGRGIQSNVRSIIYGQGIHMQILKMQLHLSEEYGTKTTLKFPAMSKNICIFIYMWFKIYRTGISVWEASA